ncbi:Vps62-related protein [Marinibactrum halimedae]|uniref:Jacalin-type lectin domain-containing protein n=1 Tax=Marinibactrum halimedae TaxID=1444977 RepID=A0AA37WPB4_9GAMM|nr:Vps62-related protein [Marinibactrum halimedae]MCD9459969.1 Vps62-related protein [Marinibactrum halimedae]GLS28263.1 hypothetical protein GCM10007877_39820 [Marinibactrum halimedae]
MTFQQRISSLLTKTFTLSLVSFSTFSLHSVAATLISDETVKKYAPLIKLHRNDSSMPTSVEKTLANATIKDEGGNIIFSQLDNITAHDLQPGDYIDINDDFRNGNPVINGVVKAPVYVRLMEDEGKPYTDIQYMLFYPYNGCAYLRVNYYVYARVSTHTRNVPVCNFGRHEGDWEHVTVRVDNQTQNAMGVFLSGHGKGNWYSYDNDPHLIKSDTHPVVYSALNSHANYAYEGTFTQADLGSAATAAGIALGSLTGNPITWVKQVDTTANSGTLTFENDPQRDTQPLWETWNQLEPITGEEPWTQLDLRWGEQMDNSGNVRVPNMEEAAESSLRTLANAAIRIGLVEDYINGIAPKTPTFQPSFNDDFGNLYLTSQHWGNKEGGSEFDDRNELWKTGTVKVEQLVLRAGRRIDQIGFVTRSSTDNTTKTLEHGGNGGRETILTLSDNEYITSAEIHIGKKDGKLRVFYAHFTTSKNNTLSGGRTTDQRYTTNAPAGYQIVGTYGRAGDELDQLGFVFAPIAQ